MNYYSVSKTGNREVNEDSTGIIKGTDCTCFIVADGLGGHGKGDIASQIAVSAFKSVFEKRLTLPMEESLTSAFQNAQNAIMSEQQRQGAVFQMKTTAAAVVFDHTSAICGHIGDTRIYTFAHNRIKERTLDHKQDVVFSIPITNKERYGETTDTLIQLCKEHCLPFEYDLRYFTLQTMAGKWRIDMNLRPVRLEHINLVKERGNTNKFHVQPRLFLSLRDTFDYIMRHDSKLIEEMVERDKQEQELAMG